jgi:hypothetical protein
MGAGKILCILGGIITLLATFLFSFVSFGLAHYYYIGFLKRIIEVFTTGDIFITIMSVVFLIIMLSGIFILIGVNVRALSIIGGILAIIMGVYWILTFYFDYWIDLETLVVLFEDEALVEGIIPLAVPLGNVGLGTYLFLGGGVLGLIGGIIGPDSY